MVFTTPEDLPLPQSDPLPQVQEENDHTSRIILDRPTVK
jgi:hypothetical protein